MKAKIYIHSCCVIGLLLCACESKTGQGAFVGAGIGAVSGAAISGNAGGALIGGAIGAGTGALIGSALDAQDREIMGQRSPQTLDRIDNQEQLSLEDIKQMTRNGLSDPTIIHEIRATYSIFHLSSEQIIDLKKAGVSQDVITYMIQTGE